MLRNTLLAFRHLGLITSWPRWVLVFHEKIGISLKLGETFWNLNTYSLWYIMTTSQSKWLCKRETVWYDGPIYQTLCHESRRAWTNHSPEYYREEKWNWPFPFYKVHFNKNLNAIDCIFSRILHPFKISWKLIFIWIQLIHSKLKYFCKNLMN